MTQKATLSKKMKKSVPPYRIRKGNKKVVKCSKRQAIMEIHLQDEILMDILRTLPVRSLVRFKCVSKSWNTVICDPYFKMKHLSHAKNDSTSHRLVLRQRVGFKDEEDSIFYSSSLSTPEDLHQLDCPSNYDIMSPSSGSKIFCCYDGLALVGLVNGCDKQLLLWNPSTRESTLLPHSEFSLYDTAFGLGYDATSTGDDGYKILKLDRCATQPRQSIEILVLKSGSWRTICHYPTTFCPAKGCNIEIHYPNVGNVFNYMDPLEFVHGAFHWLGHVSPSYSLVSFTISNEVYGDVPLLEPMYADLNTSKINDQGLSLLQGRLCFYSTHVLIPIWGSIFNLWVMKDYGVKESWTLLLTIQNNNRLSPTKPKYRFADGDFLLYTPVVAPPHFNSKFMTLKGPFGLWPLGTVRQDGIVFTESLISPKLHV